MDFNYYDTTRIKPNVSAAESAAAKCVILFAQKNSIYNQLNTDIWDIDRDATKWKGGEPGIYHPPCRTWGNYSYKAKGDENEKQLARWAIEMTRSHGGIVEHPATSKLWKEINDKENIIYVDQYDFGHRALKPTGLYIIGANQQDLPQYTRRKRINLISVENMCKKEREKTPINFAIWLTEIIFTIKIKQNEIRNNQTRQPGTK